ncbi:MAG: hypothetical protein U5L45_06930 [Saprospiraceae bacterium]|nr:hypothetical protein [Saprospiraceae bacterium]
MVHFSGKARKMNHLSAFSAREASATKLSIICKKKRNESKKSTPSVLSVKKSVLGYPSKDKVRATH